MTGPAEPSRRRVLAIGAAHVDRIARPGAPLRLAASNPGRLHERAGGAACNAALAFRRIGLEVRLVSARGGDAAAGLVQGVLEAAGVGDDAITWLDRSSASYTAILDGDGDLVAGIADMALYDLLTPRVLSRRHVREALGEADAVVVDANLPAETLRSLAAASAGRPLAAIAVSPAKAVRLGPILPQLDALFASRAEAAAIAGIDEEDPAAALAARLVGMGLRRAVVTDGPRPAIILDGALLARQRPPPVEAVRDVTGAGDTLAAVALAEWIDGRPFLEAARAGMAAASLHISTGLGRDARAACLTLAAGLEPAERSCD